MDNKQLINRLSKKFGLDYKSTQTVVNDVFDIMTDAMCSGNSIAVPGFGRFSVVKDEEHISKDLTSGKTYLFPPRIDISFIPSELLKKAVHQ